VQYGNIIFGAAVQSLTGTIQEVILDRFCHSNPVPTKNVVFPPCWKIIKIFSLLPCTVRHTVGAVVPGREIQVIYMHLNFSSRYAMSNTYDCQFGDQLFYSYWTTGILDFEIMIYLIDQMYQYGDQLWCGKSWSIWSIICMNMGTNYDVGSFFNMDLQRESDVIGFKIRDLMTGTDLRERSLTRLLTEN